MKKLWSFIVAGLLGVNCVGAMSINASGEAETGKIEKEIVCVERRSFKTTCKNGSYSEPHLININLYIYSDGSVKVISHSNSNGSTSGERYIYKISFNTDYIYPTNLSQEIFLSEYEGTTHSITEGRTFYDPTKYYEVIYTPAYSPATKIDFFVGDETFSYTLGEEKLTYESGDINKDGFINASDAAYILRYSAYLGTGGTLSLEDFIGKEDN